MRYFLIFLLAFTLRACAQTVHSNTLSWTAPIVTAPVVISGYNVYRATAPGVYVKGTPLIKVIGTSYADLGPALKGGDVRYYVVTTLCATCTITESPFSAEVKAVTPADSTPPAIQSNTFVIISR